MTLTRRIGVRGVLVGWLFLLSAVAYMDRTNVAIAGEGIREALHIDNIQLGWVFSAFLVGYAVFQVVAGWLACRYGPRRVLAAGVLWWGLFSALTAIVDARLSYALALLIAIRFALGAAEAVMYPSGSQFVAMWIPVVERGRANGWIFAGVGAGAGLSVPVLTWIVTHLGWRISFWFSAVVGTAAALGWYLLARDKPEEHQLVSREELELIVTTREAEARLPASAHRSWRSAIFNRSILAMTASYFMYGYVAWIFFSWFYLYLAQVRHMNVQTDAMLTMIPFLAMTLGCLAGGALSDWMTRRYGNRLGRCGVAVVAMALTAVFLAVGVHARGPYTASLILAGGAGALYLSQSSFWAVTADLSGDRSGVVSGVMNMGGQVGGAVTASLTPYLAAHLGWTAAFDSAALLAAVGGALWLLVEPGSAQNGRVSDRQSVALAEYE